MPLSQIESTKDSGHYHMANARREDARRTRPGHAHALRGPDAPHGAGGDGVGRTRAQLHATIHILVASIAAAVSAASAANRRRRRGLRGFPRRPVGARGAHLHIGGRDGTTVAAKGFKAVLVFPKSVEPITAQLGITNRVLDIPVPEVVLQRPGIDAIVGQLEAAARRATWSTSCRHNLRPSANSMPSILPS
jgi:hypothetical protein